MKDIAPQIDENRLWQMAFPCFYQRASQEGVYIMPQLDELLLTLRENGGGATAEERALSRLDMALVCLWPYLEDLFVVDFFPHRLAAATDLLRAADFGEGDDQRLNQLARELAAALDAVERVLAAQGEEEQSLQAAEDEEED